MGQIAAIYARKSTDQSGLADEQKSVSRQIDHAREYAARKGWTVADEHVYIDDGISGAEFANRPGFLRLMNALKPRASFQVLVMSEEARLGREAIETAYALKQLVQAGVRVFFYLEDRERTLDSPTDKIMLSLTAFADELEREKARQRTYDAMLRKARAGHVTGGRVFGYDNVDIVANDGRRSHVERAINEAEAVVVRRIFAFAAAGKGLRAIAHALNAERVPAPRAQQGRPTGWAPSSVREVLYRELYRGQIVWNQTRKRDAWGRKQTRARSASERVEIAAPHLRIVAEDHWSAVHSRLETTRAIYLRSTSGQLWGRPTSGVESKYLLTGIARCGVCGGSLVVRSRAHGTGKVRHRVSFYACSSFHHRGAAVCGNSLEMPLRAADEAILTALERQLLDEDVLSEAMRRAVARAKRQPADVPAQRAALETRGVQIATELERLTAAVLAGGEASTLVQAMRDREADLKAVRAALARLTEPVRVPRGDREAIAVLQSKLTEWRGLLRSHIPQARQLVRKLIEGRIVFTPNAESRRYAYSIPGTLARFFNGLVDPQGMASPTGFETMWTREIPGEVEAA